MIRYTILLLLLFLHTGNCVVQQFFVQVGDKDRAYSNGTVIVSMTVSSVLQCSMVCLRLSTCLSFNVNTQNAEGTVCDLLSNTTETPATELMPKEGGLYFEKTCQLLLNPMAANEMWSSTTGYANNTVLITGDGGGTMYKLELDPDYSIGSLEKMGLLSDLTNGSVETTIGAATVKLGSGVEMRVYLTENGVLCLKDEPLSGETDLPCFSEPVVSKTSIFGTEDVNALLSKEQFQGLYAFGYDRVLIVDVHESGPWTVSNTIDLTANTRLNGWAKVPIGVIGAAWLFEDGGTLVFNNAFFLTRHYYVVYNFIEENIFKRGQLCPDHLFPPFA